MASRTSRIDRSRDYLRVLIDYGSGRLKITIQCVRGGVPLASTAIKNMVWRGNRELEQVLVRDDEELISGDYGVARWMENHKDADEVLYLWKLNLCHEYVGHPIAKHNYNALGATQGDRCAIGELLTEHFADIRTQILDFLHTQPHGLTKPMSREIPIEATITVPAMFDRQARGIMISAATKSGYLNVRLQLEPVCAAAAYIRIIREETYFKDVDTFCCADVGHGTVDVVTISAKETVAATDETPGSNQFDIDIVGEPTGGLAGAHKVEEYAWAWLITECRKVQAMGGLSAVRAKLGGITETALKKQVSDQIRLLKEQKALAPTSYLNLRALNATEDETLVEDGEDEIQIRILRTTLLIWMENWAAQVVQTIKAHRDSMKASIRQACGILVLSGGGSKCEVVKTRIESELRDCGVRHVWVCDVDNPVAQGGLMQYPENEPDQIAEGFWWLALNQEWDPSIHKVGTTWKTVWSEKPRKSRDGRVNVRSRKKADRSQLSESSEMAKGHSFEAQPDPRFTVRNKHDPSKIEAVDRLIRIKTSLVNEPSQVKRIAWESEVEAQALGRIKFSIFHSTSMNSLADCGPLRDANGEIRNMLQPWPDKYIDMPDLPQHGFEKMESASGQPYHLVRCLVSMISAPGNLTLRVDVLAADQSWKHAKGGYGQCPPARPRFRH